VYPARRASISRAHLPVGTRRFRSHRLSVPKATQGCACGYLGDPVHPCRCGPLEVERYRSRVSGPLLDRIDIHLEVPAVAYRDLVGPLSEESSATIRTRVERARSLQRERFRGRPGLHANAHRGPTTACSRLPGPSPISMGWPS